MKATVRAVYDNLMIQGLGIRKRRLGDTVMITANGIEYVVHTNRSQNVHPSTFTEAGIDFMAKKVLVVKSMQHFIPTTPPFPIMFLCLHPRRRRS